MNKHTYNRDHHDEYHHHHQHHHITVGFCLTVVVFHSDFMYLQAGCLSCRPAVRTEQNRTEFIKHTCSLNG